MIFFKNILIQTCAIHIALTKLRQLCMQETSKPPIELSTQLLVDHVPIVYTYEEKGKNRYNVRCYVDSHMECL